MLRILPVTLVAVMMVLPLKLGALLDGFPVIAQQFDREFGNHERPWATDLNAASPPEPAAAKEAPRGAATTMPAVSPASPTTAVADTVTPAVIPPVTLTPPSCSDPLLREAVTEQQADTAARARRIREAEAVLQATESRVGTQLQRLASVKRDVEALMTQRSNLQQEDLRRMVAIYEAMKPRDAARIMNDLETDVVVDVLDRIAERRAAPILAEMTDAKAREVTRLVLQRRALPGDRKAAATNAAAAVTATPRPTLTN